MAKTHKNNSDKEIVRTWDKPCDEPFKYIEKVKNKKEK